MPKSRSKNNASIELVSKNGPLPIDVMMQEGVKAITRILSDRLHEENAVKNNSNTMQSVFQNVNGELGKTNQSKITDITDISVDQSDVNNSSSYVPTTDLNLDSPETELVFDYSGEILADDSNILSDRLSEMIESVLPNGFPKDAHGRLHAVMNGNELNITEEHDFDENSDTYAEDMLRQSSKDTRQPTSSGHQYSDHHLHTLSTHSNEVQPSNDRKSKQSMYWKEHNFFDYDSLQHVHDADNNNNHQKSPDFSVLMDKKNHMCLFCEYYMVFGEPPKNMIKWYSKTYGYDRSPINNGKQKNGRNQNR